MSYVECSQEHSHAIYYLSRIPMLLSWTVICCARCCLFGVWSACECLVRAVRKTWTLVLVLVLARAR